MYAAEVHEVETTTTIDVGRGADEVFAFLADAANNPQWQKGQVSCTWTTGPPIGLGSRYEQHARFAGRDIRSTFEVVAFEEGRTITIDTIESTFPINVTRSVEPSGEASCRITAVVRGQPGGMLKLLAPLTGPMMRRAIAADYRRLKELLESPGFDQN